jgi:hypothetical protein
MIIRKTTYGNTRCGGIQRRNRGITESIDRFGVGVDMIILRLEKRSADDDGKKM